MSSRGDANNLYSGVVFAVASGIAVGTAVGSGGINSLVGVAISASLLPPVVNAGMCLGFAYGGRYIFAHGLCLKSLPGGGYDWGDCPISAKHVDTELYVGISYFSSFLFLMNIVVIWVVCMCMFKVRRPCMRACRAVRRAAYAVQCWARLWPAVLRCDAVLLGRETLTPRVLLLCLRRGQLEDVGGFRQADKWWKELPEVPSNDSHGAFSDRLLHALLRKRRETLPLPAGAESEYAAVQQVDSSVQRAAYGSTASSRPQPPRDAATEAGVRTTPRRV